MLLLFPNIIFGMIWFILWHGIHHVRQPITTILGCIFPQITLLCDIFYKSEDHYFACMFILWCSMIGSVSLLMFSFIDFQIACYLFSAACWQYIRIMLET